MSAPSLSAISGRAPQLPAANGQSTSKMKKNKQKVDAMTVKTESAHSNDPAPSTSFVFDAAVSRFSLELSFPSVLLAAKVLRGLKKAGDTASVGTSAQIFSGCVRTVIRSMDDLPFKVRRHPSYEVAQCRVILLVDMFQSEVTKRTLFAACGQKKTVKIATAIELVEITLASLRSFLKIAEDVINDNIEDKPLPALPAEHGPTVVVHEQFLPLVRMVDEMLYSDTETISESSILYEAETGSCDDAAVKKRRRCSGSIIRHIVRRGANSSKIAFFTNHTKSSATLVNPSDTSCPSSSPKESFSAEEKARAPEVPYIPRQSAIYYLADPYAPDIDVDMPLPVGDTVAIRLDHNGVIKAASLTALVRLLTSIESILDADLMPTFFVCFRFFSTPMLFFHELMKRYDEKPPDDLSSAQLRVWLTNHISAKIRVGRVILTWLDLYWRPDADIEVLKPLQDFVVQRLAFDLPESMMTTVFQLLDRVWDEGPDSTFRISRKVEDLQFIYSITPGFEVPAPTNFTISIDPRLNPIDQLMEFNTGEGREEIARQLTARISAHFQCVDPEDAVKYWHTNEDSKASQMLKRIASFERALCSWVTSTVLSQVLPERRCHVIEFWLDVAVRCARIRNFSSANFILSGIATMAIGRMKQTVLLVNVFSKGQYRTLQSLFTGQDNFAGYRDYLTSIEPTVPLMTPHIRDVISALAVVPTSIGSTEDSKDKKLINLCSYRVITKTVKGLDTCLMPYGFRRSDAFNTWLDGMLADFPDAKDNHTTDRFYDLSAKLEAKEPALNHLTEPWSFTITGTVPDSFTLHKIPPPVKAPTKKKKYIPSILRRFW